MLRDAGEFENEERARRCEAQKEMWYALSAGASRLK